MKQGNFKFEKLKVWEKAIQLSNDVHMMTRDWPKEEMYILTSQIKRATDSISLNIAEGCTGQSDAEFKKFLSYSSRSALEVINCLYLAKGRELIDQSLFDTKYEYVGEIVKMIFGLKNSIGK
ncbi:four helix bundle protein [Reichenbachiella versicolor]|uniref:four helix bundle protein n=1 Tax=Reichenbachiella versicolor TaxID=1821036 RepID=UPI000D6E9FCB|nr:four helix bundle protein [Reichenbachiella versicolor]